MYTLAVVLFTMTLETVLPDVWILLISGIVFMSEHVQFHAPYGQGISTNSTSGAVPNISWRESTCLHVERSL